MLFLYALFIFPVISIFVFKPQLPKGEIESAKKLLTSYARTGKHFVTAFLIVNSTLAIGARAGLVTISFSYISIYFEPSIAEVTYSIFGKDLFTLYALKFHANYFILHLTTNLLLGMCTAFNKPCCKSRDREWTKELRIGHLDFSNDYTLEV